MKILGRCESCNRTKFLVRHRTYKHKMVGVVKSQSELCGKCYRAIKKMLGAELVK